MSLAVGLSARQTCLRYTNMMCALEIEISDDKGNRVRAISLGCSAADELIIRCIR